MLRTKKRCKLGKSSFGYKNQVRELQAGRCGQSSFNTGRVRTAKSFNVQLPGGRIDQLAGRKPTWGALAPAGRTIEPDAPIAVSTIDL